MTVIPAHPAAVVAVVTAPPAAVQAIQVEVAAAAAVVAVAAAAVVVVLEAVVEAPRQVLRKKEADHQEIPGKKRKGTLREETELPHMGTTE